MTSQKQNAAGLQEKRDGDLLRLYTSRRSEEAFAELRRRYLRLVYSTCLREIGDPTLAEDAAQGVFLLLNQKSRSLERRETLADWLYAASRHISRNLRRQEQKRQMRESCILKEMPATPITQEQDALWDRVEPHLDDILARLKPADRQAILLRFMQQQSLAEVGVGLGISENTARMRVLRALEKIRTHLGRAGVVVPGVLLASVILERSASAVPASLFERFSTPPVGPSDGSASVVNGAVRQTALRFSLLSALKPLIALIVIMVFAVEYLHIQPLFSIQSLFSPHRLNPREQRQVFRSLDGIWRGSLEYADDQTGQHSIYPTTVTIQRLDGGTGLSLVAAYVGSSAVDRTTLTEVPGAGKFSVTNGGPRSSHPLASVGELVQMGGGDLAFQGKNPAQDTDVRIQFTLRANSLTMQEEYRPVRQSNYQFRNRFTLSKE